MEGEIESITGVEDGIGSDEAAQRQSLPVALEFIRATGVDVFAPAIGNAHGVYRAEPKLDAQRVSDIVAAQPVPIALHGGTGMTDAQFTDLIARGCAKVNISTALKVTFMKSSLDFLRQAEERDSWDPAVAVRRHPGRGDSRWPPTTCAASAARARPGEPGVADRAARALIFDCDGVLADTERYGHLVAFNQMFEEFGLPVRWSPAEYKEKLRIGGGKERMASLLTPEFVAAAGLPADPAGQQTIAGHLAPPQDRDLHRAGRGRGGPAAPGHRPGGRRGAGRGLAAGRRLDLGGGRRSPRPWSGRSGPERARQIMVFAGDVVAAQEARPGHLPARPGLARPAARPGRWSSRTPATGCWPPPGPAWPA